LEASRCKTYVRLFLTPFGFRKRQWLALLNAHNSARPTLAAARQ
jgi:hypothetical protein